MFVDQIRERATIIIWISCIASIGFILYAWNFLPLIKNSVLSNNAYIRSSQIIVSSNSAGLINKIYVEDYEKVKAGQPLFDVSMMGGGSSAEDFTTIYAPEDGQIGLLRLSVGQYVKVGEPLLVIVEPNYWVIASFKETQINKIQPGQKAKITVDALKGKTLHGRVTYIAPATGSEFSLLKPEDTIGNFVKLTQKVAVRIDFDDINHEELEKLKAGLSVEVEVNIKPQMLN